VVQLGKVAAGLGDVGHVRHAVTGRKFQGGLGQVVRAVGLSVLPVEERLFADRANVLTEIRNCGAVDILILRET